MGRIDLPDKPTGSVVISIEHLNGLYEEIVELRIELAELIPQPRELDAQR